MISVLALPVPIGGFAGKTHACLGVNVQADGVTPGGDSSFLNT